MLRVLRQTRRHMTRINLNPTETKIRNLLVDYCDYYNSKSTTEPLVLRFTGGWVRDKLLGIESNDIDIAINHLSGEDFATKLRDYLQEVKNEPIENSSIHTIKKNPAKSKHLETCTTKLFGLDIDFVNLRSEAYTEDSRVPVIEYGTPQEDAMRRDATLNALFYNVNEDIIEDFTERGLKDLEDGILRTPLAPLQTFLDDPLRVLRLIRFASRLNYSIALDTLEAMGTNEVKHALIHKISRERVGIEVEKIVASAHPEYGFQLINYAGLTDSIFSFGDLTDSVNSMNSTNVLLKIDDMQQNLTSNMIDVTALYPIFESQLQQLRTESSIRGIYDAVKGNSDLLRAWWYAVALYPFELDIILQTSGKKKQATGHIVDIILRGGLKASNADMEKVTTLINNRTESELKLNTLQQRRSDFGLFLKKFGNFQGLNVLFNLYLDCLTPVMNLNLQNYEPAPNKEIITDEHKETIINAVQEQVQKYEAIVEYIHKQGLEEVHNMKILIDGKQLSKELGLKPGPWMGQVNNEIMVWQLDNPEKSKDDCLEFVKSILPNYL